MKACPERREINQETQSAWNAKAKLWDDRMGAEGNDFHRPLHLLFGAAFEVDFVLDGLEEPSFPLLASSRQATPKLERQFQSDSASFSSALAVEIGADIAVSSQQE